MPTTQPLSESDRRELVNLYEERFLHGECYAFAIALHRKLGWDIVGLMKDGIPEHVVLKTFMGQFFDARGPVTEPELFSEYPRTAHTLQTVSEELLYKVRGDVAEEAIAHAIVFAEAAWPSLPWGATRAHRMHVFLDALEQLSKQHGIWIYGTTVTSRPLLEIAADAEGYTLHPLFDGKTFALERRIRQK